MKLNVIAVTVNQLQFFLLLWNEKPTIEKIVVWPDADEAKTKKKHANAEIHINRKKQLKFKFQSSNIRGNNIQNVNLFGKLVEVPI